MKPKKWLTLLWLLLFLRKTVPPKYQTNQDLNMLLLSSLFALLLFISFLTGDGWPMAHPGSWWRRLQWISTAVAKRYPSCCCIICGSATRRTRLRIAVVIAHAKIFSYANAIQIFRNGNNLGSYHTKKKRFPYSGKACVLKGKVKITITAPSSA